MANWLVIMKETVLWKYKQWFRKVMSGSKAYQEQ